MAKRQFTCVTYIAATPSQVWKALFDPALTRQYWQHDNVSDWLRGSVWEHRRANRARTLDLVGKVVESSPPRRLIVTWADPADAARPQKYSRVTLQVAPCRGVTRLSVLHDRLDAGSAMLEGITDGWPKVFASLKSLLETGHALPRRW